MAWLLNGAGNASESIWECLDLTTTTGAAG